MYRPFSLFIALRLFRAKSQNRFLSFISWASMVGLVIGVAALIIITSVLNGFELALTERLLGMVPHASIHLKHSEQDWQSNVNEVISADENIIAAAPFVRTRGMTSINGEVHGTIINGILPSEQSKVSILNDAMIEGNVDSLTAGSHHIILGRTLVESNQLTVGDDVSILMTTPSDSVMGMNANFVNFTLSGVFDVSEEMDNWMSFIAMDDASNMMNLEPGARGIRLKLDDVMQSLDSVRLAGKALKDASDQPYTMSHWQGTHGGIYETIQMQKTVVSLLLFLIILVAAFNIISTLVMLVTEKKSDIAILKTYGATPKMISNIFVTQGVLIGIFGTSVGLVLGLAVTAILGDASAWVNTTFELGLFDDYFVKSLPTQTQWTDVLIIVISSLSVSVLAALYPARRAANMEAITVLGGE